jgi:hypothetical protein
LQTSLALGQLVGGAGSNAAVKRIWWVLRGLSRKAARRMTMAEHDHSAIKEHMTIIGADGVHVGTVDHLDGERIKMAKSDSVDGKHHYLPAGLVAGVEGDTIRLSATGATAVDLFEEAE